MVYSLKRISIAAFLVLVLYSGSILAGEVIQTQESDSWEGIEVDLINIKVKNSIVTAKFKMRNTGSEKQQPVFNYGGCYIIDETNQKKYYPLKDSDGLFIAGPMYDNDNGGRFWYDIYPGKSKSFWIKFPEPTDIPESITISIPGVFPFEEVGIKR